MAQLLPDRLRGNGFGVLGLVQSVGDLGSSAVVGVLWSLVSPELAFGYAAAWMLASLAATRLTAVRQAGTNQAAATADDRDGGKGDPGGVRDVP